MKLPFSFGKKEEKQYYLALLLQDEKIGAVLFEEIAGKIHVSGQAEKHFRTSLEEAASEEWLDTIDKAVSNAEASLSETIQAQKTVFGVKQEWIIEGKIKKGYLTQLKKICDELSLQPIGFLVFTEAIIHLLQQEEGAPVSAILIEIGKKIVDISIVRAGRIIETKQIPFAEPVPEVVDEALKHFSNIEILPARIILFDSENNEKITQAFTGHSWSRGLPFLHVPQTTVLPPNFDTKGVLYGTATQMGFEVEEREIIEESKGTKVEINTEKRNETELQTNREEIKDQNEEKVFVSSETVNADYFGFITNGDVADAPHTIPDEVIEQTRLPEHDIVGQAIEEIPEEVKEKETGAISAEGSGEPRGQRPNAGLGVHAMLLMEGIKKGLHLFKKRHPTSHFSFPFLIIPGILIIGILLLVAYIFGLKATVTLHISPKTLENAQDVTFAIDGQNDFSKNIIAAQTIKIDENGTQSTDATGTKKVGTPAKGKVTIFSRLTDNTNIAKGTVLTASNGLQYTLDDIVHVASFSGDTSDPSVNVSNVSVTSKDIGTAYNLPSGTKLTITGLDKSDVSAKNDAPFSGGTQKEITVVDQKDLDKALDDLIKSLTDKAKNELHSKIGGDKYMLPVFAKQDVSKKTFDKKAGDEAKTVNLNATITYQGASYSKSDITDFAKHIMKDKIPSDSDITNDGIQTEVSNIKQNKDTISANLAMKASLVPKLDIQQIAKEITGKSFTGTATALKNRPQVSDISIHLQPNFPFLPKFLPRLMKNIHIIITVQ